MNVLPKNKNIQRHFIQINNIILNSVFNHMRFKFICNTDNYGNVIRFMNTVSSGIGSMKCWGVYKASVYPRNSVRVGNHSSIRVHFTKSFSEILNLVLNDTQTAPIWTLTNSLSLQKHPCFKQAYIILNVKWVCDKSTRLNIRK